MALLDELNKQRDAINAIAMRNNIDEVRVFGSVVQKTERPDSDVDFLVKPHPGASLLDLGGFLSDMEDFLGRKVQVVTEQGLHWYIRERVLRESKPL